jgi:regulatory protein
MKITRISQQKRTSRVNIFIDDQFAFGLSKKTLVDFNLFNGKFLNEKDVNQILEKDQLTRAVEKSFRLLGVRPRSQKELEKRLKEKEFAPETIKKTIARIKELGYLDDKKFAKAWLEARKFSHKGKYVVQRELKQKGVAEETITKTISHYTPKDELKIATELIEKKMKSWKDLSFWKKKEKIAKFLASRGFSWNTIGKILGKIS